jgi:dihydroorotase-like cyclic amidohydrolase
MDPKQFVSKSLNSPFDDWNTKGRAILTVVGGDVVYQLD